MDHYTPDNIQDNFHKLEVRISDTFSKIGERNNPRKLLPILLGSKGLTFHSRRTLRHWRRRKQYEKLEHNLHHNSPPPSILIQYITGLSVHDILKVH